MFDGVTYSKKLDLSRLKSQLERVKVLMSDGKWRGLDEIQQNCGGTAASISARLRDLRKYKFGSHTVNKKRVGSGKTGYFEYRMEL